MSRKLLSDRQFSSLFWTQFLGALNDNFFKNALVVLMTYKSVRVFGMDTKSLVALAGGIFILPFFLFSPFAGRLTDKWEKSHVVRLTKIWELGIMVLGVLGFALSSYYLLLFVLFLMGTQSTFFGPAKYSLIPQLVGKDDLVKANAYVETATFMSILIGSIAGGLAAGSTQAVLLTSIGVVGFALMGIWTSRRLKPVSVGDPFVELSINPLPALDEMWDLLADRPAMLKAVVGISWFWFVGAGLLSILPSFCKEFLLVDETVLTTFLATFTAGIGVGSLICSRISKQRIEMGLVPLGAVGMSLFMADMSLVSPTWFGAINQAMGLGQFLSYFEAKRLFVDLFMISVFGGIMIVPLYALMQERSEWESRSRVIAANNVLNAGFIVVSSVLLMVLYRFNFTMSDAILVLGGLNVVVVIALTLSEAEFVMATAAFFWTRLRHRPKVSGLQHLPTKGSFLLAANHVTPMDWLLIAGVLPKPVRFLIHPKHFESAGHAFLLRRGRMIPASGHSEDQHVAHLAIHSAATALQAGEIVGMFPEGHVTHTGKMGELRPEILDVVKRSQAQVIPVYLYGLWRRAAKPKSGPIQIRFGRPIPPDDFSLARLERDFRELAPSST
ncbi:MAG: MFS transporter [Bdellovibrionales bacterium]